MISDISANHSIIYFIPSPSIMGTRLTTLGADSGVPGFTRIFSSTGIRKSFWIGVVLIFITLTVRDLIDLIKDYVQYPVTVNVRIADSRVLPFPAITICNLNLVHRSRFCAAKNVEKPEIIENILCAKIGDMLNQCKISNVSFFDYFCCCCCS